MFGTTSAYRFFEKAREDYERVERDIADPGAALNCILSCYHLHEWVWARWLKQRPDVQVELGIRQRKKDEFIAWLDSNCPHFSLLQELANGTKHCRPVHSTQHIRGFGRGPFGIGPFGAPYLLIDPGGEHPPAERYLVASSVLKEIMGFWTRFFTAHCIVDDKIDLS
jgi:hypothetical protein